MANFKYKVMVSGTFTFNVANRADAIKLLQETCDDTTSPLESFVVSDVQACLIEIEEYQKIC